MNPRRHGPTATFFRITGRPVEPLSLSFGPDHGHAHSGGVRNRLMARMIGPVTATSASWKVMDASVTEDVGTDFYHFELHAGHRVAGRVDYRFDGLGFAIEATIPAKLNDSLAKLKECCQGHREVVPEI